MGKREVIVLPSMLNDNQRELWVKIIDNQSVTASKLKRYQKHTLNLCKIQPVIMKPPLRDNIYKEGSIVYTKSDPKEKLFIRRYVNRIYFCRVANEPERKELTLFEREITDKIKG